MMGPDVRTELLKLRSAGRTEFRTLAGCIQVVVMARGQQKQGIVRKRSIWRGSIGGHALTARTPCASRFPVSFAGTSTAVLSTQEARPILVLHLITVV
jgi:hypothetical protein